MTKKIEVSHWGKWVKARAFYLGISTQRDLSRRVGKSQKTVSQWLNSSTPNKLRPSSLTSLAGLLQTTPQVLLREYTGIDPTRVERDEQIKNRDATLDQLLTVEQGGVVRRGLDAVRKMTMDDIANRLQHLTIDELEKTRAFVNSLLDKKP